MRAESGMSHVKVTSTIYDIYSEILTVIAVKTYDPIAKACTEEM